VKNTVHRTYIMEQLNPNERLDLKQLMRQNESDYKDNTDGIRRLKHSDLILADIRTMELLKKENAVMRENNPDEFSQLCQRKCSFLQNSYMDIYNRLYKDTLDVALMTEALATLKKIENGDINQHEGSVQMGQLFYKVFVSSAVQVKEDYERNELASASEALAESNKEDDSTNKGENIGWREFKMQHLGNYHPGNDDRNNKSNKKKSGKGKNSKGGNKKK
jgi:hypothetical protein